MATSESAGHGIFAALAGPPGGHGSPPAWSRVCRRTRERGLPGRPIGRDRDSDTAEARPGSPLRIRGGRIRMGPQNWAENAGRCGWRIRPVRWNRALNRPAPPCSTHRVERARRAPRVRASRGSTAPRDPSAALRIAGRASDCEPTAHGRSRPAMSRLGQCAGRCRGRLRYHGLRCHVPC